MRQKISKDLANAVSTQGFFYEYIHLKQINNIIFRIKSSRTQTYYFYLLKPTIFDKQFNLLMFSDEA